MTGPPAHEYVPKMTPGRELYERWLTAQDISPDDLWDYIDPHERIGWEALASGGAGEAPAGLALEGLDRAAEAVAQDLASWSRRVMTIEQARDIMADSAKFLRAALRGQREDG